MIRCSLVRQRADIGSEIKNRASVSHWGRQQDHCPCLQRRWRLGRGFCPAVSKRWPEPQAEDLKSARSLKLGEVSFVKVGPGIWVANMIAQRGIRTIAGVPPIRYDALRLCLGKLALKAQKLQATIHMPRIGCGLAGGKWGRVEPLIREAIPNTEVFVYDLPH